MRTEQVGQISLASGEQYWDFAQDFLRNEEYAIRILTLRNDVLVKNFVDRSIIGKNPNQQLEIRLPHLPKSGFRYIPYAYPEFVLRDNTSQKNRSEQQKNSGKQEEKDYFEARIQAATLRRLAYQDLGLPDFSYDLVHLMQRKEVGSARFSITKTGPLSKAHWRRAWLERIKRQQIEGDKAQPGFTKEDLRHVQFVETPGRKRNALLLAIGGTTAECADEVKYLGKGFYDWDMGLLSKVHDRAEIVFVPQAQPDQPADENTFFNQPKKDKPLYAPACEAALSLLGGSRYLSEDWSVYIVQFLESNEKLDTTDCKRAQDAWRKLVGKSEDAFLVEARPTKPLSFTFLNKVREIGDPRIKIQEVRDKAGMGPLINELYKQRREG